MSTTSANSKKIVLITGASSGIGASTASFLAKKGYTVILVARREDKLKLLHDSIIQNHGVAHYFVCDLSSETERISLFESLSKTNLLPDILINNAGFAWYGYFSKMPWTIAKELLSVNIEAVVHLTNLFLPNMEKNGYGHIINIGSIAGKLPEQGIALYSSSKAFLDAYTTSLFREMQGKPIHVSVVRAGPIKTEFYDSARKLESGGSVPAEKLASPVEIVAKGIFHLIQNPRKVVYIPAILCVSPLLEFLFSKLIDILGPLLLRKTVKDL